jgi:hypothetical protein
MASEIKVSLSNGRSYGKYIDFADGIINKIDRGQPLYMATCKGRQPGSRIELVDGKYKLI